MSQDREKQREFAKGETIARLKKGSLHFEILIDMEEAFNVKKGVSEYLDVHGDRIFTNAKRGDLASHNDLEVAFGTSDISEIGKVIIKQGEILIDQAHRDEEKEKKIKQVVDFLSTNAIDSQSGNPISPERIKSALNEARVNIKNVPIQD